jgi:protocatechuate 3,4-dioxygenase, alpha subunit
MSTPSQTVGPFFAFGLCDPPHVELMAPDAPDAIRIVGRVTDGEGKPVNDAMIEIWQADRDGRYDGEFRGFGRCGTDENGDFAFVTVKPGPVESQAPHVAVQVFARGLLKQVFTRVYFPDEEEANAADPVLSAVPDDDRATLVAVPEDGALRFDIRLQGERQTVFFGL